MRIRAGQLILGFRGYLSMQMTPEALLKETERAVGDTQMIESHKALIELKGREKTLVSVSLACYIL